MNNEFDRVLDECIDRINRGESIEACLKDYPQQASELKPILNAMSLTRSSYSFTPSPDAKREARKRFHDALEKSRQPSIWQRFLGKRMVWATLTAVLVVLVGGSFAVRMTIFPNIPTNVITSPNANGNFAFLVSDDVNAIDEFSAVNVTVDKVTILKSSDSAEWVEFTPQVKEFDLSLLPGDKTQELWRGDIPEGQYSKVVIYVTGVTGTLKSTGETISIKLPSNKLEISSSFQVSADSITSFTYDLTVVKTGNERNVKYILKPQAGESGANLLPLTTLQTDSSKGKGKNPTK